MMGPYMLPIPILGTAAAFFSVVFAFVFTPSDKREMALEHPGNGATAAN
jgi:hypothetical protein